MGVFDQFKKIKELNKMKEAMKNERAQAEDNGVKVVANGNMEIESIVLNTSLGKEDLERIVKDCSNRALKDVQKKVAQVMMNSGFSI